MKTIPSAALALAVFALAGCEVTNPLEDVELRVDVTDAPVAIPASAGTVAVRSDAPTANSGTATNDTDIERVEELRTIRLQPSYFSFASAVAGADRAGPNATIAAQSGTIRIFIFLGGVPIPDTPIVVTVEDNVVTGVAPQEIEIASATINAGTIESFLDSLPPGSVPDLADGWQTMTVDEVVAEINQALASSSIAFTIGVEATGGLDGTLQLSEIAFDAEIALADD